MTFDLEAKMFITTFDTHRSAGRNLSVWKSSLNLVWIHLWDRDVRDGS